MLFCRLKITNNSAGVMNENISTPTNGEIEFQPNDVTHTKNVSIQIKNNDRVENNVTFSVTLLSENSKLLKVGQPNETVVTILDNDGKIFYNKWLLYIYQTFRGAKYMHACCHY